MDGPIKKEGNETRDAKSFFKWFASRAWPEFMTQFIVPAAPAGRGRFRLQASSYNYALGGVTPVCPMYLPPRSL